VPPPLPRFDEGKALATLGIAMVPFDYPDGNVQGFADKDTIAINPIPDHYWRTLFHEIAHIELGHTGEGGRLVDKRVLTRDKREVEAECVAYICGAALELDGADESRGYIQHWMRDIPMYYDNETEDTIVDEDFARQVFTVADKILKAGRTE